MKLHVYEQLARLLHLSLYEHDRFKCDVKSRSACQASVVLNIGVALKSLFKKIIVLLPCHDIDVSVRNI